MGIDGMTVYIPGVGLVSMYDYAGQERFHKTHGLLFSALNSFFILLVSLLTGTDRRPCTFEELIEVAQYRLSSLRASLGAQFIPTVMIAGSRADCCPDGHGLSEKVVSHLREVFKGKVIIREECFLLDCRKSWSSGMEQFRNWLKQVKRQFMQVRSECRAHDE